MIVYSYAEFYITIKKLLSIFIANKIEYLYYTIA